MAKKYDLISELYNRASKDVVANPQHWQEFLRSACHNYKLRFDEQLLVYAQRPNATAVLEIERWNTQFGRWVNKGACGIAVFEEGSRSRQKLNYYFDISDTHESRYARKVPIWKMKDDYEGDVIETLESNFGILEAKDTLTRAILSAAQNAAEDNLPDYLDDLLYAAEDSYLNGLQDDMIASSYKKLVKNSVAYMLMARLEIPTEIIFEDSDFADIVNFNTQDTLNAIGIATSDIAEMGLTEIRKTVRDLDHQERIVVPYEENGYNTDKKEEERSFDDEQNQIYRTRRLQDSELSTSETEREKSWKIRTAEKEVSERTSQDTVLQSLDIGETERSSLRNGAESVKDGEESDRENETDRGNNRAVEIGRHDALGSENEQPKEQSTGNRDERGDLRLEEDQAKQLPSIKEQKTMILDDKAEEKSSAFTFSQEIIDSILCRGSGIVEGKFRIYDQFQKSLSRQENVEFLKNEYGWGGAYPALNDTNIDEMHDAKGILISQGLGEDAPKLLLKWKDVEKRLKDLIQMERYLNPKEKESYPLWQEQQEEKRLERKRNSQEEQHPKKNESLEGELLDFIYQTNFYEYSDSLNAGESEETMLQNMKDSLENENEVLEIVEELKKIVPELDYDPELEQQGKELLSKVQTLYATFLINDFYEKEYQESVEFDDLNKINLAYTQTDEGNHEVQVDLDLIQCKIHTFVDGKLLKEEKYEDLDNLIEDALKNLEFDDLVYLSESEMEKLVRINFDLKNHPVEEVGKRERYRRNVTAIQILKQCQEENRFATVNEQLALSKYVGWGGLSEVFDDRNFSWGKEYLELKRILTEEEYISARASTLTAFYTPPAVINAVYQVLGQMGFEEGNLLEPSCGIGHFIGLLPESMKRSKVYGIEIDTISAGIAQQLYQKTSIAEQGFEETNLPDSFFDGVIGNVPFGEYRLSDKRYDKHKFLIHDYFFAKSLDKLRPAGVMALVTSKGTMDKENSSVRRYIAQRADLLGAIRLPNDTFKGNAGTEVVSDILFFQKRDRMTDIEPDWIYLGENENGIRMNQYFVEHPEMILGQMEMVSGRFGPESTCVPYENAELEILLNDAISNIHGEITPYEMEEDLEDEDHSIAADPSVRNFSYTIVDDQIYYRENSRMNLIDSSATAENRIKGMIAIRDCVRKLIDLQTEDHPEEEIRSTQKRLNQLYDSYTKKYGLINSRANNSAFSQDSSYCLLSALEVLDEEGNLERKADMFYKRTIQPHRTVTSVDTISEALAVSMGEKAFVDMQYMTKLCGKEEEEIYEELKGTIFLNPLYEKPETDVPKYLMADEYLSGNVREKLKMAKTFVKVLPEKFQVNVEALEKIQPKKLTASEIEIRLGATWLPPEIAEEFMYQLLDTPRYAQWNIKIDYSPFTSEWYIKGKSYDRGNVKAYSTYGTERVNAYKIIEETLNLKDVRIFDYIEDEEGKKKAVLNKKETAIAQGKQEQIKQAFKDWVWDDPERRERLTELYNEKFNSLRPREYDGSSIVFAGMNPEISLREHQKNAVAHILYGGNTLLAHCVGAGKTFEMVAAAQESKRLGLCNKSLFVVPNHLTEQWAAEYLQLYPSANILVATKKDFEKKNRKRFCGRIATGDYDAVIIGHSQFEKIPMSIERQRILLENQIDEITEGIEDLKRNRGENFSIKQLEKTKKNIKVKLDKLNDQSRKDDVVTFEELGVDRIFIDESHYYKNLFLYTKMRNVGGIAQTEAQKSSDLFMKCRYLDEITGDRGVVFATGTPISNSMVELYTMQRYLQYNTLQKYGLQHFDAWASTFGETVTAVELTPEGSGYRAKTRFANFYNLPELMTMFKEVADIQTADMLNLPVPEADFHNVAVKPSQMQKEMVQGLAERAEKVRNGMVDSSEDNMLKITNDGRKLALDQRLFNDLLPDFEGSKLNTCVENMYRIWEETKEKKSAQLFFCDLSTPKNTEEFSVYKDVKRKLVAKGIPEEEIQFIHDANTELKKQEVFKKTRKGEVRILMGSTQKMGAGTNVQDKLIALHDLDCPWRPADLEQRLGRIVRQGNENPKVEIFRYVTEETFDAYLYQLIEGKQKFASQIMTSKSPVRSCEDIDETALSYAEIKMLATGNPHIKEKMDLDIQVQKLKLLKSNYLSEKYALEDKTIKYYPQRISRLSSLVEGLKQDVEIANKHPRSSEEQPLAMTIKGVFYSEKEKAGDALISECKKMTSPDPIPLGEYRGFQMELFFDSMARTYNVKLKGESSVTAVLGQDVRGNIVRIDNAVERFEEKLFDTETELENTKNQFETAKKELVKPFQKEKELEEKLQRLNELNIMLDMDKKENEMVDADPEVDEMEKRKERAYER